ncbi:hypothetical protein [Actinokineospora pegani]|uniref:hypothetical protein n=1 Tax=Actinokineospora pegani TaxID=2654637 RepID=UPI0012E9E443|nr:hypothetical protein [Actinokineospora pegani]
MTAVELAPAATRNGVLPAFTGALAVGALVVGPAAAAAGWWSLAALGLAGLVAGLTAVSRVDLLAQSPSGDPHALVRERFGPMPARLSGVLSLAGRLAAAAAVALAAGAYLTPTAPAVTAVVLVVGATALVVARVALPPAAGRALCAVAIVTLLVFVAATLAIPPADALPVLAAVPGSDDPTGVLIAAGLFSVGFAGTAGPTPASARAGLACVGAVMLGVLAVGFGVLHQLGGPRAALSPTPLLDALTAADGAAIAPLVVLGVAAGGFLAVRALLTGAAGAARELAEHGETPTWRHTPLALGVVAAGLPLVLGSTLLFEIAACLLLGHTAFANSAARSMPRADRTGWVRTGCCGLVLSVIVGANTSIVGVAVAAATAALGGLGLTAWRRRSVT